MIEEKLATGSSVVHKLDPVVRITCAGFISVAAALSRDIHMLFGYLIFSLILVIIARLPVAVVFSRLKPAVFFLLLFWILIPVTFKGDVLFEMAFLKIAKQGVELCSMVTVKSVAILLFFMALIATMPVASLGNGLQRLKVPEKLVFILLMTYRYIAVIETEYRRLVRAASFRGFKSGANLHSYKTWAYLAGMLFVRASLRAQRVHQAMLCRGFTGRFHTLDVYPPTRFNVVFGVGIVLVGLSLVGIEWIGV